MTVMKRLSAILIYIYVSLSCVKAQEVKVTAVFDSTRIYIGDQTNFTVTIDKPVSYILSIPIFKDSLQKNIEILKGPSIDTSFLKDGRMRIRQKYLVTSFDSGYYQVPPIFAEMTEEHGVKRFYSDYSPLTVMRVKLTPPDTASKIFDIISPYKAPLTVGEVLPWLFLFLLLCGAVWYLIRIIKKMRMKKSGEVVVVNPDPAHVIAFRQLEQLHEDKIWEKGDLKGYYTRLTEIIRQYLENRFKVYSMELTTVETLAELTKTGFREDETYRKLRTVLTGADLVKFAKFNPEPSDNELQFSYAWDFVEATKLETGVLENKDASESNPEKR
jgi:hypothetical protein